MSEIKTLNGYSLVDNTARERVRQLTEEIETLKGEETITKDGTLIVIEANEGAEISVDSDTTSAVALVHCGKNLMPPMYPETVTKNGVTITRNSDNRITFSGTATERSWPDYIPKNSPVYFPAGSYVLSADGIDETVALTLSAVDGSQSIGLSVRADGTLVRTTTFTLTEGKEMKIYLTVSAGTTYEDKVVSVQLERGYVESEYEPCSMEVQADAVLPVTLNANAGINYIYTKTNDVLTATMKQTDGVDPEELLAAIQQATKFDATVYGLPVLTLDGDCAAMTKDNYVPLAFTFQDKDGDPISGTADVKKQGSSSIQTGVEIGAAFDTDLGGLFNFTLKFPDAFEAKEGWGAQTKYCFKANAIDHSHARNVCSCILHGQIVKSRANVPTELSSLVNGGAIDGFPIVIVLNGKFYALGTFNIPKDGWMFGSPKAILCADAHVDATKFKALATLDGDFELEYVEDENNADWVLPSINRAIQAVMDSDGSDLDTVVGQYIDIPSAIDYYIHTVDEDANDGLDKNYILVTFDGVKWYFSAYDRDTVYGLEWNGKSFSSPAGGATYAYYAQKHQLMNLIYVYKKDDLKARAIELREGVKSETNVCNVFTNFAASIPAEVLAQNCKRWPLLRSTNASNTAQILNWYRLRRQVIDKEIDSWN